MVTLAAGNIGDQMGLVGSMLVMTFLTYWNYRAARRNSMWAWSKFFLLLGAVMVFVFGFILPLAMSKAMDTHLNRTIGIMMGGTVTYAGVLYYFFSRYPLKPRQSLPTPRSRGVEK